MYRIKGIKLAWFRSYLANRVQYISITHDLETDTKNICCGVPQGSILEPLLFLFYVNDLHNSSTLDQIKSANCRRHESYLNERKDLKRTARTQKMLKNRKKLMHGLRQTNSLLKLAKQNTLFSINQVENIIFLSEKAESGKWKA